MWAIAQRADLPVKIEACVAYVRLNPIRVILVIYAAFLFTSKGIGCMSQIAFLCQSSDHASDYRNALAGSVPGVGQMLLRDCLAKVHQDIITCWNFRDEDKERRLCGVMRDPLTMFPVRS